MKVYTTKSNINCGPCSFINMTGLKGTINIEKELSSIGRLKPFHANNYTSFLLWARKYNKDVCAYVMRKKIDRGFENLMINFEKVPKSKTRMYKMQLRKRIEMLNRSFSKKIIMINDPIKKLDELLKEHHKVAVLISDYYLNEDTNIPHWIVAYKKNSGKYYFMDSSKGKTMLTRNQIIKGFKLNEKNGIYPELISYGCKNVNRSTTY